MTTHLLVLLLCFISIATPVVHAETPATAAAPAAPAASPDAAAAKSELLKAVEAKTKADAELHEAQKKLDEQSALKEAALKQAAEKQLEATAEQEKTGPEKDDTKIKAKQDLAAKAKATSDKAQTDWAQMKDGVDKLSAKAKDADATLNAAVARSANADVYSASLQALTKLFVIAVLLESAFAFIFRWSVFLKLFPVRPLRPLIMLVGAWLLVYGVDVDVVARLVNIYNAADGGGPVTSGLFTKFITALIMAGGSAGVYNIMVALGFRQRREQDPAPVVDEQEAWLSIKVKGSKGKGKINVLIRLADKALAKVPTIAGTLGGDRPGFSTLFGYDGERFPGTGGYTLKANTPYCIEVLAYEGEEKWSLLKETCCAFASRAIVDWEVPYLQNPNPEEGKKAGKEKSVEQGEEAPASEGQEKQNDGSN